MQVATTSNDKPQVTMNFSEERDNLDADIAAVLAEVQDIEDGTSAAPKPAATAEQTAPTTAKATSEAPKPEATTAATEPEPPKGEPTTEPTPKPKVTMVPHAALHEERKRRQAAELSVQTAETRAQEAEQQLAQLRARLEQPVTAATTEAPEAPVTLMDEDTLKVLEEESPALAKAMRTAQSQFAAQQRELAELRGRQITDDETRMEATRRTVQESIDNNPKLLTLFSQRADNPAAWQRAVALDKQLKTDPAFKGIPIDERFERVVSAYEAVYGEIDMADPAGTHVDDTALDKVVAAKLTEAAGKAKKAPATLSDIPQSVPNVNSPAQEYMRQSASQLHSNLNKLSEDKVMELLAQL